ncbi:DUF7504 family protein [Halobellus rubicundus]|uniref:Recombinase RecA n=1 Tax=Halobellus rubicundus TaxID=2996466 RepID=A0ABD5MBL1_9EURY
MHTGGGTDGTGVGATVGVATALDELKSRGSALLVVGSVPEEVYARVSGCMLGDSSENRRRVVVEGGESPEVRFTDVDRWTPEWTRVFRWDADPRRSAAAESRGNGSDSGRSVGPDTGPNGPGIGRTNDRGSAPAPGSGRIDGYADAAVTVDGPAAKLGVEVGTAISELSEFAGGLGPAELRVAFDCTTSLLSAYDEPTAFRFLHVLANNIRRVDGMGHVRLPKPLDDETTRLLAPLFDAVVELRLDGTEPQQRWHFRDADVTSEWLPVDEPPA